MFYLDFCKAFDSVPHHRLLTKMRNLGISGNTLDIVKDFLSGRRFKTFVGGAYIPTFVMFYQASHKGLF